MKPAHNPATEEANTLATKSFCFSSIFILLRVISRVGQKIRAKQMSLLNVLVKTGRKFFLEKLLVFIVACCLTFKNSAGNRIQFTPNLAIKADKEDFIPSESIYLDQNYLAFS